MKFFNYKIEDTMELPELPDIQAVLFNKIDNFCAVS